MGQTILKLIGKFSTMDLLLPLKAASAIQLQTLAMVLWDWKSPCSAQRLARLSRFFKYYTEICNAYVPEIIAGPNAVAIRSHEDILDIIRIIKTSPNISRAELTKAYFIKRDGDMDKVPPTSDQNRAFNIAVSAMVMMNCSSNCQESILESGTQPTLWRDDATFSEFLERALPKTDHLLLNDPKSSEISATVKTAISARRLKKKAGLRFVPTDDLREHLQMDRKKGLVRFFHHTAFVKECLIASQSVPQPITSTQSNQP